MPVRLIRPAPIDDMVVVDALSGGTGTNRSLNRFGDYLMDLERAVEPMNTRIRFGFNKRAANRAHAGAFARLQELQRQHTEHHARQEAARAPSVPTWPRLARQSTSQTRAPMLPIGALCSKSTRSAKPDLAPTSRLRLFERN